MSSTRITRAGTVYIAPLHFNRSRKTSKAFEIKILLQTTPKIWPWEIIVFFPRVESSFYRLINSKRGCEPRERILIFSIVFHTNQLKAYRLIFNQTARIPRSREIEIYLATFRTSFSRETKIFPAHKEKNRKMCRRKKKRCVQCKKSGMINAGRGL